MVRLSPRAFRALPRPIVRDLLARGCTVPQSFAMLKPHNVIRGRFYHRRQRDWAVLCSRAGISAILVYWGGSVVDVAEIASVPDEDYLQDIGGGHLGLSRLLERVGREYILDHDWDGQAEQLPLDHEGINDYFLEKASVVHYYHEGAWLQLGGAD